MASIVPRYFRSERLDAEVSGSRPSGLRHRRSIMFIKSVAASATAIAESIPDSIVSLMARLAAGGVFWRSGQTKIEGLHIKESTFFLFREEYMVPLLPPDLAAYMAT